MGKNWPKKKKRPSARNGEKMAQKWRKYGICQEGAPLKLLAQRLFNMGLAKKITQQVWSLSWWMVLSALLLSRVFQDILNVFLPLPGCLKLSSHFRLRDSDCAAKLAFASWSLGYLLGSAAHNSPTTRAKTGRTAQVFATPQKHTHRKQTPLRHPCYRKAESVEPLTPRASH